MLVFFFISIAVLKQASDLLNIFSLLAPPPPLSLSLSPLSLSLSLSLSLCQSMNKQSS